MYVLSMLYARSLFCGCLLFAGPAGAFLLRKISADYFYFISASELVLSCNEAWWDAWLPTCVHRERRMRSGQACADQISGIAVVMITCRP